MNKSDVERYANLIAGGANPVVVPNPGGMPMLKLSEHYPRLIRETLRNFCIAFQEEAAQAVLTARTPAEAAQKVRATLTWE